ncbi:hypothetical protein MRX96_037834 [Rhipicephalus microplus]
MRVGFVCRLISQRSRALAFRRHPHEVSATLVHEPPAKKSEAEKTVFGPRRRTLSRRSAASARTKVVKHEEDGYPSTRKRPRFELSKEETLEREDKLETGGLHERGRNEGVRVGERPSLGRHRGTLETERKAFI